MGTRQVPLCWPEPECSVSGYSSMSLVSASSGHAEGTATLQLLVTLCLQNMPRLSGTVAHLGLRHGRLGRDRSASGPVVVSLGGQYPLHGLTALEMVAALCQYLCIS